MTPYDALGAAYELKVKLFMTAIAGERALTAMAGLKPGNSRVKSLGTTFRMGLISEIAKDLQPFTAIEKGTQYAANFAHRYVSLHLSLDAITREVIAQSSRQATFGKIAPMTNVSYRRQSSSITALTKERLANPSFKVKDSAGRLWDADKLSKTLARDAAYQLFIDSSFEDAILSGVDEVTLTHPNEDHPLQGQTFALDETWRQRRAEVFHINSSLTISYGAV